MITKKQWLQFINRAELASKYGRLSYNGELICHITVDKMYSAIKRTENYGRPITRIIWKHPDSINNSVSLKELYQRISVEMNFYDMQYKFKLK